jgi:hypothetical protein
VSPAAIDSNVTLAGINVIPNEIVPPAKYNRKAWGDAIGRCGLSEQIGHIRQDCTSPLDSCEPTKSCP